MTVKIKNHTGKFLRKIDKGIDRRLTLLALSIEAETKKLMAQPKSGAIYRVPGFKKTYQASAPGQAPAVRTGNLFRRVTHEVGKHTVRVGSNVKYHKYLEWGTARIAARPSLRPALRIVAKKFKLDLNI